MPAHWPAGRRVHDLTHRELASREQAPSSGILAPAKATHHHLNAWGILWTQHGMYAMLPTARHGCQAVPGLALPHRRSAALLRQGARVCSSQPARGRGNPLSAAHASTLVPLGTSLQRTRRASAAGSSLHVSAFGEAPAVPTMKVHRIAGDGRCLFRALVVGKEFLTSGRPVWVGWAEYLECRL